jgi:DMSO/TMAO reductase YedYZ heme-binding membrane subunit
VTGIISLLVMAALCAFCVAWVRRRMGLGVSRNTYVAAIVIFILVTLALWGRTLS